MATLAFNREEIAARELRPELLEMDGISRASVEAHYKLYQGYVAKRNEILAKLGEVDLAAANQVYSEIRALKVDLTFAIGGVKNHEIYSSTSAAAAAIPRHDRRLSPRFGSTDNWRATQGDGHGGAAGLTAYDQDEHASSTTSVTLRTRPDLEATPARRTRLYEPRTSSTTRPTAPLIDAFFETSMGCRKRLGQAYAIHS